MQPTLYLLPSDLGAWNRALFPPMLFSIVEEVPIIIAENPKTTRRFLRGIGFEKPFEPYQFETLDKRTHFKEVLRLVQLIQEKGAAVYVSEAGSPCVADPGSQLVQFCHDMGVRVQPVPGPSSILLALAASGLNGQSFSFEGYLPINDKERKLSLKRLEKESHKSGRTILFMEAPYRNNAIFKAALHSLHDNSFLCVACDITTPNEWIKTYTIGRWKKQKPIDLHKRPCIFVLQA